MNIKKYFESLTTFQKVEVYLIVLMSYFLVFIFIDDIDNMIYDNKIEQHPKSVVSSQSTKKERVESLKSDEIINIIDNISKVNKVTILESQILSHSVQIKLEDNYDNVINFLNHLENSFEIKNFEILAENGVITLSVSFGRKYNYSSIKDTIKNIKIRNPFYVNNDKIASKVPTKDFKITAILDDEVLVDGAWYKHSNILYDYKIVSIQPNEVLLEHIRTKQHITKKVSNE